MGAYIKINGVRTSAGSAILTITLNYLANALLTMLLWNAVMPGLGLGRLNVLHAFFLWTLCRILFTNEAFKVIPKSDV